MNQKIRQIANRHPTLLADGRKTMRRRFPVPFRNCRLLAITLPPPFYTIPADCVTSRQALGSVSFQVVWLSSPCSGSSASRLCSVHTVPQLLPPPQLPIMPLQSRRSPMRHLPRRQMAQPFGQRFLAPVTRRPSRGPHNPPRPFPTLRQTSRIQQPPRRRKSRHPNVTPILPQQVKRAQLMRRFPP